MNIFFPRDVDWHYFATTEMQEWFDNFLTSAWLNSLLVGLHSEIHHPFFYSNICYYTYIHYTARRVFQFLQSPLLSQTKDNLWIFSKLCIQHQCSRTSLTTFWALHNGNRRMKIQCQLLGNQQWILLGIPTNKIGKKISNKESMENLAINELFDAYAVQYCYLHAWWVRNTPSKYYLKLWSFENNFF